MMESITQQYLKLMSCFKSEKGQTLVEYALLLVLIAIVVIAAVTYIGQQSNTVYCCVGSALTP